MGFEGWGPDISGLEIGVRGSGCRVKGVGCRGEGVGFTARVTSLFAKLGVSFRFQVSGFGCRV